MKNLLLASALLLLASCGDKRSNEYAYKGTVVSKGYEPPTSAYKSRGRDPVYFIMMREDSSGKVIRVNVTVPTWHSLSERSRACFVLSNRALYYAGNTTDWEKNLYEQ